MNTIVNLNIIEPPDILFSDGSTHCLGTIIKFDKITNPIGHSFDVLWIKLNEHILIKNHKITEFILENRYGGYDIHDVLKGSSIAVNITCLLIEKKYSSTDKLTTDDIFHFAMGSIQLCK